MRHRKTVMSAVLGLGLAAALGTVPAASAATPHIAAAQAYAGQESAAANQAFFAAVLKSAEARHAAHPDSPVTITYDASQAPTFASQISDAVQIWDSSVTNVQIEPATGGDADYAYTEGDDPDSGSYAQTDGHGHGTIFIDYTQAQEYNSTRIVAHETGHVLGLPDDYTGPCSELMSGHGPGPSCQNTHPDANEIASVNQLWADGFGPALAKRS
jgi:snapalysin